LLPLSLALRIVRHPFRWIERPGSFFAERIRVPDSGRHDAGVELRAVLGFDMALQERFEFRDV